MKLTKEERKDRRKRILKGVGKALGGIVGGTVGVALDVVPGAGAAIKAVTKAAPAAEKIKVIKDAVEGSAAQDLVPLGRTWGKVEAAIDIIQKLVKIALELVDAWDDIKDLVQKKREGK